MSSKKPIIREQDVNTNIIFVLLDGAPDADWEFCRRFASMARTMFLDSSIGGSFFDVDSSGCSFFERQFAVLAASRDESGRADLMHNAASACGSGYFGDFMNELDAEVGEAVADSRGWLNSLVRGPQ